MERKQEDQCHCSCSMLLCKVCHIPQKCQPPAQIIYVSAGNSKEHCRGKKKSGQAKPERVKRRVSQSAPGFTPKPPPHYLLNYLSSLRSSDSPVAPSCNQLPSLLSARPSTLTLCQIVVITSCTIL